MCEKGRRERPLAAQCSIDQVTEPSVPVGAALEWNTGLSWLHNQAEALSGYEYVAKLDIC